MATRQRARARPTRRRQNSIMSIIFTMLLVEIEMAKTWKERGGKGETAKRREKSSLTGVIQKHVEVDVEDVVVV